MNLNGAEGIKPINIEIADTVIQWNLYQRPLTASSPQQHLITTATLFIHS